MRDPADSAKVPPTGFGLDTKPFNLAFQLSAPMTAFSQRPPAKVTESKKSVAALLVQTPNSLH